ncbi:hypothetical protein MPTK1_5g07610 [Marchantia polymorpha subsp. ruderalis]|uniref:Uncharacterized protein n=2 Tax=Marchantia polymorpha TaxID=3197 RepID=A0AAF6BFZ1_MARPO|nr:hypothetical protein MARPO_0127s0024 [Marchantia polymorpha]BBN10925.1 hypothetical protein Mp_5g07610 [Marchantia polymorpha subsp. ruderalis]|eukprot:PTQ30238.1 hypothetical protein MARPO_0127s0024 [Marchantia polymorpha]
MRRWKGRDVGARLARRRGFELVTSVLSRWGESSAARDSEPSIRDCELVVESACDSEPEYFAGIDRNESEKLLLVLLHPMLQL